MTIIIKKCDFDHKLGLGCLFSSLKKGCYIAQNICPRASATPPELRSVACVLVLVIGPKHARAMITKERCDGSPFYRTQLTPILA